MRSRYGVMAGAIAVVSAFVIFGSGCNQQQIKAAARQSGIAAVAAWYYTSDVTPSDVVKQSVHDVTRLIKDKASGVAAGGSYHETLYPAVVDFVNVNVPQKDRMAVILGTGWVLTGIDSFLAMNPQYNDKQQAVLEIVGAFCDGVLMGLGMPADAPIMKAIQPGARVRRAMVE